MDNLPTTKQGLIAFIVQLQTKITQLEKENQDLRLQLAKKKARPPFHPKANVDAESLDIKTRQSRKQAFVRKRSKPTHQVVHAVSTCSDCQVPISGQAEAYTREVIDIFPVTPMITEHVILKRRCWNCGKWWTPEIDWSQWVIGQSRFGVSITSLVATLREQFRIPIRFIQRYCQLFWRLEIATGEIVRLLHQTAHKGEPSVQKLKQKLREAAYVCGDETGWRENGKNGYLWSYSTPTIRYFLYRQGRGSPVVTEVLGSEFEGIVVSDFYGAYNIHSGDHQRCWAHLLRDMHDLVGWFPERSELARIEVQLRASHEEGKRLQHRSFSLSQRHGHRRRLEKRLLKLAKPYLSQKEHPFHTLAKRIDRFVDELFIYVLDPRIPSTNNEAERSLRHNVIARKITGGTRSKQGSETKAVLSTLFGTWTVRNLNPFEECKALLTNPDYSI